MYRFLIENVRRIIRNLIGWDSGVYNLLSHAVTVIAVIYKEDLNTWRLLKKCASGAAGFRPIEIKFKNLDSSIAIRSGKSDVSTVINNIIREEYGAVAPTCKIPKYMLDAGAYIGDTAAFFLTRYKELKVISLEPNGDNFGMAKTNLKPYGKRVILLQKALWGTDKRMGFAGDQTGGQVSETGDGVECISIPTLMHSYCIPKLDILKMDVEGAEKDVFKSNAEGWLSLVDLIIIEIHGDENLRLIAHVLQKNSFEMVQYRSVWYCRRISRLD
jgi:FkbM family methyltransferase